MSDQRIQEIIDDLRAHACGEEDLEYEVAFEAADLLESFQSDSYREATQVTGYCPICAERAKQEQQEPLTCDGCSNLPNKYGYGVTMNAPCRFCIRGIKTSDYYKPATEPKGGAREVSV